MEFLTYALIGFAAQMLDSAVGMAFGTLSSTLLLALGFPPQAISPTVHAAGIFSGASSAFSHYRFKNIDWEMFKKLAPPAIIGAIAGSLLVVHFPGQNLKPWIASYFVIMGGIIIIKSFLPLLARTINIGIRPVGLLGGFFDAFGGAGWGAFVSSGLIVQGKDVRAAVGSLNAVEFLMTTVISGVFIVMSDLIHWPYVGALAIGGILGAPIGAWICKRAPTKWLTMAVGIMVLLLGLKSLLGF